MVDLHQQLGDLRYSQIKDPKTRRVLGRAENFGYAAALPVGTVHDNAFGEGLDTDRFLWGLWALKQLEEDK